MGGRRQAVGARWRRSGADGGGRQGLAGRRQWVAAVPMDPLHLQRGKRPKALPSEVGVAARAKSVGQCRNRLEMRLPTILC